MEENTKTIFIIGYVFTLFLLVRSIIKVKSGKGDKVSYYDENSMLPITHKDAILYEIFILVLLTIAYILMEYFGFK